MSEQTPADQSRQSEPVAAVEDVASTGAQAEAQAEVARAHATAEDGLQPPAPETSQGSSESEGQTQEGNSQSAEQGEGTSETVSGEPAPSTSRRDVVPDPKTTAADSAPVAPNSAAAPGTAPFTPRQVGAAEKFGFSEEDLVVLEALGQTGRGLLERLVKADSEIGRRYSRLGRAEQSSEGIPDRGPLGLPSRPAGVTPAATSATEDASTSQGDVAPTPAPEAASLAEEVERLRGQVLQLEKEAKESQAARDQAAASRERGEAERFFAQLDAQEYPQFGRGDSPPADLKEGSSQGQAREELLVKAAEIRRGHALLHGREMDVEESLREALSVVAPGAAAEAARRRLARQLRLRSAGLICRPAQRRGGAELESPADRTARALEEWQGRRGVRFFED